MGKRRGGNKLALKTGIVAKKQKTEDEVSGWWGLPSSPLPSQLCVLVNPCPPHPAGDGCAWRSRRALLTKCPDNLTPYLCLKARECLLGETGAGQLSQDSPDPVSWGLVIPPNPLLSSSSLPPQVLTSKGDAWAKYMAEVKKYKAHQCGDDDKTRPLVK